MAGDIAQLIAWPGAVFNALEDGAARPPATTTSAHYPTTTPPLIHSVLVWLEEPGGTHT